ncbi:MAG: hypothetical protein IME92_02970, partial [Proteobacteria bacterium]|nr:hypothetical protein [Pseudomonadota bacterium]
VLTLLPSARLDDEAATYLIDNTGNISTPLRQASGTASIGNLVVTHSVIIAGKTYLFTVERGISGVTSYWMQPGDTFSNQVQYSGDSFDYFSDVAAFASVSIGEETYLFTASAFDAGLNSFNIDANGVMHLIDSVAPSDASGFSLPQALQTITVNGQAYLLMASAGTNSLTVYVVGTGGALTEVDHLIDGIDTRFDDASVLESFTYEGRGFILAAGSDDGLTLIEISARGTLSVLAVLADDFDTTLNNITDIEVAILGTEIHAFVSSGVENGFTQIRIDIDNTGLTIIGNETHEVLNGNSQDDTLLGMGGSDRIYGGNGNDLLVDGAGRDHFYGGAGADIFRFAADNTLDLIRDYEIGIDLIDLSLLGDVALFDDLDISSRSFGAVIIAGAEEIRITSVDNTPLYAYEFTADDFIF